MKSKELKSYNLPEDRVLIGIIDAKPTGLILGILLIGAILTAMKVFISGIMLMGVAAIAFYFLPKRVLIEFYSDFMVLRNHANFNDCDVIYYEDVVKWRYHTGLSYDSLDITLVDDSVHSIDGYSKITYETFMNKFLKDKKDKTKPLKNKTA